MLVFLPFVVYATAAAFPQPFPGLGLRTTTPDRYRCDVPQLPHGRFELFESTPGEVSYRMAVKLKCDPGYDIYGSKSFSCLDGQWFHGLTRIGKLDTNEMSTWCKRICDVPKDPSVEYRCLFPPPLPQCFRFVHPNRIEVLRPCPSPEGYEKGYRPCEEHEKNGTVVQPVCRSGYHSASELPKMHCVQDAWDVTPTCLPNKEQTSQLQDNEKGTAS